MTAQPRSAAASGLRPPAPPFGMAARAGQRSCSGSGGGRNAGCVRKISAADRGSQRRTVEVVEWENGRGAVTTVPVRVVARRSAVPLRKGVGGSDRGEGVEPVRAGHLGVYARTINGWLLSSSSGVANRCPLMDEERAVKSYEAIMQCTERGARCVFMFLAAAADDRAERAESEVPTDFQQRP